jgi:dTDP-4-amino-4,6-dideoxygalactose transaminase
MEFEAADDGLGALEPRHATTPKETVPVLRPQLPSADRIFPYLRRIDATRVYSNWGPLSGEFENQICNHLCLPPGAFVSASSGTSALIGAILATAGPATEQRTVAVLPALTFVATAIAAERCGYKPYFKDVDAESWMLDPDRLLLDPLLDKTGVVIPVAPFGRPVRQVPWTTFKTRTGIPVVIDGAASFDRLNSAEFLDEIPVVLSFHATKSLGIGEGGGIATRDLALALRLAQALNFGFRGNRDSEVASINGKMSEYHAAVGLAGLDDWRPKVACLRNVADRYRCYLSEVGLLDRLVATPSISSSYVLFKSANGCEANSVMEALNKHAVEFRLWYGRGLQYQTHYSSVPHESLPVTDDLLQRLIGIPLAADLTESEIARVVGALVMGVQCLQ